MKKWLSMLLALMCFILLLSLSACGDTGHQPIETEATDPVETSGAGMTEPIDTNGDMVVLRDFYATVVSVEREALVADVDEKGQIMLPVDADTLWIREGVKISGSDVRRGERIFVTGECRETTSDSEWILRVTRVEVVPPPIDRPDTRRAFDAVVVRGGDTPVVKGLYANEDAMYRGRIFHIELGASTELLREGKSVSAEALCEGMLVRIHYSGYLVETSPASIPCVDRIELLGMQETPEPEKKYELTAVVRSFGDYMFVSDRNSVVYGLVIGENTKIVMDNGEPVQGDPAEFFSSGCLVQVTYSGYVIESVPILLENVEEIRVLARGVPNSVLCAATEILAETL